MRSVPFIYNMYFTNSVKVTIESNWILKIFIHWLGLMNLEKPVIMYAGSTWCNTIIILFNSYAIIDQLLIIFRDIVHYTCHLFVIKIYE